MESWWRVLRGVVPYKGMVILSMICAIGVGLSYASGVAVMLPVMKVFISSEGLQGWADRMAAQSRLDATLWDLDTNSRNNVQGLRVEGRGRTAADALHNASVS